jgi:hypothetical protein
MTGPSEPPSDNGFVFSRCDDGSWRRGPRRHLCRTPAAPALALLAEHRVVCERCARTRRHPPADEDDRCDWCGARGDTSDYEATDPDLFDERPF